MTPTTLAASECGWFLFFIFFTFYFFEFLKCIWLDCELCCPLLFDDCTCFCFVPVIFLFMNQAFFFFGKNPECNFIWGPICKCNLQYFFGFDWKQKMSFLTLFLHLWATKSLVKIAVTNLKKKKKKKKGDYKKCDFHWQPHFFGFLFSSDFIFRPVTLQFRTLSVNGIMVAIK